MKPKKDRMMRPQETKAPATLICKSECVVHGFGTIQMNEEVTEEKYPGLIAYLTEHGEHPNFISKEE
jgi:hypothetical protein